MLTNKGGPVSLPLQPSAELIAARVPVGREQQPEPAGSKAHPFLQVWGSSSSR